jgi:hypothetical protein
LKFSFRSNAGTNGELSEWRLITLVGAETLALERPDAPLERRAAPLPINAHASSSATKTTTAAMYPNNDTLGERLRLYVEENLHDA